MRIADIIRKDLVVVLRDGKAFIFIVLMPIVLMTILGLALGGVFSTGGYSIGQIDIAVVDLQVAPDQAEMQQEIRDQIASRYGAKAAGNAIQGMEGIDQIGGDQMSLFTVLNSPQVAEFISYEVTDADTARQKLENGEISAVVTIPESFASDMIAAMITGSGHAEIEVTGVPERSIAHSVVSGVVGAYTDTISQVSADIAVLIQAMVEQGAMSAEAMAAIDIEPMVTDSVQQSVQNAVDVKSKGVAARKPLDSFAYYSIAITCMFVLYSAGQGSTFLQAESAEKTLARLRAAGVSRFKLLFGKSIVVLLLTILQLIILFAFSTLAFGLAWGNMGTFILISLCVALSVTGLGVLLMVLVYRADNPRIGNVFQGVIVQVLALFGGSYLPLSQLPKFFSAISLGTPNGLAIHAYTGNATGAPLVEVLPYMAACFGLGVVLFIIGVTLFPRERRA